MNRTAAAWVNNSVLRIIKPEGLSIADQEARYGAFFDKTWNEFVKLYGTPIQWELAEKYWEGKSKEFAKVKANISNASPVSNESYFREKLMKQVLEDELAMSRHASTLPRDYHPPLYLYEALKYPSIEALNIVQASILQRQGYHVKFHNLYRISDRLGSGAYGQVWSLAMRTQEIDLAILKILATYQLGEAPTREDEGLTILYEYLSDLPKVIALKTATAPNSYELLNEYVIGREISALLRPLNIRCFPVYYAFYEQTRETEKINLQGGVQSLAILGRPVGDNKPTHVKEYYLYLEAIEGKTFLDTLDDLSTEELNGLLLYLHGVFSYLYKSLEFVHADWHLKNMILTPGTYSLPIIDEDGMVIRHIHSRYQPVVLDLGLSKTRNMALTGNAVAERSLPAMDIAYVTRANDLQDPGCITQQMALDALRGDFSNAEDLGYIMPFWIYSNPITHEAVRDAILSSGAVDSITDENPPSIMGSRLSLYNNESDTKRLEILAECKRLKPKYRTWDYSITKAACLEYLTETEEYYKIPR